MKVLFLAPQPFYQERGTPIAIDRLLKAMSDHGERVDVLTYHEGSDMDYVGVKLHRTTRALFIRNIRPGFSWKKMFTNFFLLLRAIRFVTRERFHLVHAVEEAVFIAVILKFLFKIPYVYDMDSSLSQQMVESKPFLKAFTPLLDWFEGIAVRNAKAVVPVCDALVQSIKRYKPTKVMLLPDISLLEDEAVTDHNAVDNICIRYGINNTMLMYVGNLEPYQGIDLLIESFALARRQNADASLVVIGGDPANIAKYQQKCRDYAIADAVYFLGPRPIQHLAAYLSQADILTSPRIKGNNTPMKIYSYLDSGKALLATRLPTHTQVMTDEVAGLADPNPQAFGAQLLRLVEDPALRRRLGTAGKELIAREYTVEVFNSRVHALYDWLQLELDNDKNPSDRQPSQVVA
jgi:glycosyltransferase involved in cell wall biosynthesis